MRRGDSREAFSYSQNHIAMYFYISRLSEGQYCTVTRSVGFCGSFVARYQKISDSCFATVPFTRYVYIFTLTFSSRLPMTKIRPEAAIFFLRRSLPPAGTRTRCLTRAVTSRSLMGSAGRTGTRRGNRRPRPLHSGPLPAAPHTQGTAAHPPELSLKRRSGARANAMTTGRPAEPPAARIQRDQRPHAPWPANHLLPLRAC